MSAFRRKSRVGFVVIKVSVGGTAFYLMRINQKWKDVNFVGGHEKDRDAGSLEKTARRELWEEVPPIRDFTDFGLRPLTQRLHYGPIESRSKGGEVEYELQFFLLAMDRSPEALIRALSERTKNIWVAESDLLIPRRYRVSGLVKLLEATIPGGLQALPYSSAIDLDFMRDRILNFSSKQIGLALI